MAGLLSRSYVHPAERNVNTMKRSRIIPAACAGLILAACGNTAPANETVPAAVTDTVSENTSGTQVSSEISETSSETVSETVTEKIYPPAPDYPDTLTLYDAAADGTTVFDEKISEKLEEITGIKLEVIIPSGNVYDELFAMSESGELPDLIYGGEYSDQLADIGIMIPIDEYIDAYGENLSAMYGSDIEKLRHSDGKIYTVGTGGALNESTELNGTFQIQNRVLAEAGYPEIKTLDQLEQVIKDYLAAHPTNPSGAKNYGMLLCGGPMTQWHITVGSRSSLVLGYTDDGDYLIDDEVGSAIYKWLDSDVKKYYKWLNHLYNEGIIADDSFNMKYGAYIAKLKEGNVLAVADNSDDFAEAQQALYNANLGDRMYFPIAPMLDESRTDTTLRSSGFAGEEGIGISSSCADPARAFVFLDMYCSDEVQLLVNRGIEGDNYTVENNTITPITPIGSSFVYPFPMAGTGAADSRGIYFMERVPERQYGMTEQKTLEGYGIRTISEMFAPAWKQPVNRHGSLEDLGISEESEIGIIQSGLEVYIRTEVTNAIMLPEDEFDDKWDEIQEFVRNGGGDMLTGMMTDIVMNKLGK